MRNPFKVYRIDSLFIGFTVAMVVLLIGVVTFVGFTFSSRELVASTVKYQQALMSELNQQIVLKLTAIEQQSLATSRNLELQELLTLPENDYRHFYTKQQLIDDLSQIVYSSTAIASIELYMENTGPYTRKNEYVNILEHDLLLEKPWYELIKQTDFAWLGEQALSLANKQQHVVSFANKIYSYLGEYQGLLVMHMKSSVLQEMLAGQHEYRAFQRILLDSGGRIVSSVGSLQDEKLDLEVKHILSGDSGYQRVNLEGEDYLVAWNKSPHSEWTLIEWTPWSEITEGSYKLANILLFIGFLAAIIGAVMMLYLSRQMIVPIRHLLSAMNHFSVSKSVIRLPNDYRNEFGVLFNGYSKLIERINELYRSLQKEYTRKKEAEINALQAMINPHFLYNTLDQVNWMAIEEGQEKISQVVELMGRMFRIGLSNGAKMIPLHDEVSHLSCYLQIQQIRWGDGLEFEIDVPESLQALYVPKMTLQPFVENAVVHGLHGRSSGCIKIKAEIEDDRLILNVQDNGVGIASDWHNQPKRIRGGYGIRNVKERIDIYFGTPYGVDIEPLSEGGTKVTISLPQVHEPMKWEEGDESDVDYRHD